MFGIFELFWVLGMMTFGVLGTAFWIWMLIDCAKNEPGTIASCGFSSSP